MINSNAIDKIAEGHNFILYYTMRPFPDDMAQITALVSNVDLGALHLCEIRGYADKKENTLKLDADICLTNMQDAFRQTRIMALTDLNTNRDYFETSITEMKNAMFAVIGNSYCNFVYEKNYNNLTGELKEEDPLDYMSELLCERLYIEDAHGITEVKNAASCTHESHVKIFEYALGSTDPFSNKDIQKVIERVIDDTTAYSLYILEHKSLPNARMYFMTEALGDATIDCTLHFEITRAFDQMLFVGAFSYYGADDIILKRPSLTPLFGKGGDLRITISELLHESIYEILRFINKLTSKEVQIKVHIFEKDKEDTIYV